MPKEAVMAGPEPKLRELFSKAAECQTAEEQAQCMGAAAGCWRFTVRAKTRREPAAAPH